MIFLKNKTAKLGQNFTIDYQANANLTFFNGLDNTKSFYEMTKIKYFDFRNVKCSVNVTSEEKN